MVKIKRKYTNLDLALCDFSNKILIGVEFVNCNLREANFQGSDLSFARFKDCDMYRAEFERVILYVTSFDTCNLTRCRFDNAFIYGVKFHNINITYASFYNLQVETERRDEVCVKNIQKDQISLYKQIELGCHPSILKDGIIKKFHCNNYYFNIRPWSGRFEKHTELSQIYNRLKRIHKEGQFMEEAAYYYYMERKETRMSWYAPDLKDIRKIPKYKRVTKTLLSYLFEIICGYGEKPSRVLLWFGITWVSFGLMFLYTGTFNLPLSSQDCLWYKLYNALYYSMCSLLTISPNILPTEFSKILTSIEAIIGVVLISLLTATLVRKIIRD